MYQGHELVHALPEAFLRAEVVQQRHRLRHHQERIPIGGVATAALESGPDGWEGGLGGMSENQIERGGPGHAER